MSNQGTHETSQVVAVTPDSPSQHGGTSRVMFSLLPVALMLSALWRLSQGLAFEIFVVITLHGQTLHVKSGRQAVAKKMPFLPRLPEKQSSGHGSQALANKQW